MKESRKIIKKIKEVSQNNEFKEQHTINKGKNFVRQRKISFSDIIMYEIANTRNPIAIEAERFSSCIGKDVSSAALCKARQKISYTAFKELFEITSKICPLDKKYHNYRLIAVDGMKGELPRTPELVAKYRISPQSNEPIFHAVAAFDVLNEIFIASEFHCGSANERELAGSIIDQISEDEFYRNEEQIWIFDRGFPALELLQNLKEKNFKFVMRVSKSFLREVNEFRESKYVDKEVHVNYTVQRSKANKVEIKGQEALEFDLRCVRINLPKGEEILITNLDKTTFPKRFIKEIYSLRWGIETNFNQLKNSIFVEEFTSKSENGFQQDYYASLLMFNFVISVVGTLNENIPLKKQN